MSVAAAIISLRWKARVMVLLRKSTRPIETHPRSLLSYSEIGLMCEAYADGWSPEDFAKLIQSRDLSRQSPAKALKERVS